MNIGFLTNIASPYKTLQINEFSRIENINITVYYTEPENNKIKWEAKKAVFKEMPLKQYQVLTRFNIILNSGISNIVKKNDVIILSGYDQLSMIYLSLLCRLYKKPYIILFDGISKNRLEDKEIIYKKMIKKMVVHGSFAVMANGTISKKYLIDVLNYSESKVYNQFLSVDNESINKLYKKRDEFRLAYRKIYGIDPKDKVLLFSGRLIEKKNIKKVIHALSEIKNNLKITLLITGGGELEKEIIDLASLLNVNVIVTGFLNKQEELFKHYFAADALILPSKDEPWGLVVNECMVAGLPVVVSDICGCSYDLVENGVNGFTIDHKDEKDIANKILNIFSNSNIMHQFGENSRRIISNWTFENSRISLEKIIKSIVQNR